MTDLKKEIQKILHPEYIRKEDLHPPRAPRILTQEQEDFIQEKIFEDAEVDYGNKTFERAIVSETSVMACPDLNQDSKKNLPVDSKPAIDISEEDLIELRKIKKIPNYWRYIKHGDTKRSYYIAQIESGSSRVSYETMTNDLEEMKRDMQLVKKIKMIDPNARNFGNVINEFKEKVQRLREK